MSRPVWPPKILSTCSLVLFAVIMVLGFALGGDDDRWLATWGGADVGLVILALIPVIPFTEQFARESTPRAHWNSPAFKKVNLVLSAAWGVAILALGACRVAAAAIGGRPAEILLGALAPVVLILAGLRFSRAYPKGLLHGGPAPTPTRTGTGTSAP